MKTIVSLKYLLNIVVLENSLFVYSLNQVSLLSILCISKHIKFHSIVPFF